jgi:hypothetical protein
MLHGARHPIALAKGGYHDGQARRARRGRLVEAATLFGAHAAEQHLAVGGHAHSGRSDECDQLRYEHLRDATRLEYPRDREPGAQEHHVDETGHEGHPREGRRFPDPAQVGIVTEGDRTVEEVRDPRCHGDGDDVGRDDGYARAETQHQQQSDVDHCGREADDAEPPEAAPHALV